LHNVRLTNFDIISRTALQSSANNCKTIPVKFRHKFDR